MPYEDYDESNYDLDYLNNRGDHNRWQVLQATLYSRCMHCGDVISLGEECYWNPDSMSVHKECVPLMQGLEHAMSKEH